MTYSTHGRPINGLRLVKNALWNLLGLGAPLFAAAFAIPVLINGAGIERFGVLSLAWLVIGYFSLFDLGVGRALIKLVSEKIGSNRMAEIPELVSTTLFLMVILGLVGGGAIIAVTDWLVLGVLNIPEPLQGETLKAFRLLAWSVPVVIITTGLRGVLEGYQRFDLVNLVRVSMGVLTFVGPILVLPFTKGLDAMVWVLFILRVFFLLIHLFLCDRVVPGIFRRVVVSRRHVGALLALGGWMTVTNIVGPLMVYVDRLLIGSVLSLAAVAYYVTPYELITKLLVIPVALMGVLFPAFSANLAGDRSQATGLFQRAVRWVFLVMFPLALLAAVFASDVLRLWLSEEFSVKGTSVLQWLAIGVLFNGLAQIPFAFIQGNGRPDLTAKLHFAELPFYLLALFVCINHWGVSGAAVAWTLRSGLDAFALFAISVSIDNKLKSALKEWALMVLIGLVVIAAGVAVPTGLDMRITFAIGAMISFGLASWRILLTASERAFVNKILVRFYSSF